MSDIFELMNRFCPDGVPYYRLDQVFDISQGYSPSMDKKEYWEGGTVPFFSDGEPEGRWLQVGRR